MSLSEILKSCRVYGDYYTHVSMLDGNTGTYQINRNIMENFYTNYTNCKEIKGLLEKPQVHLPILVDFDLKMEEKEDEMFISLYTKSQLESVIRNIQEVIKCIINNYDAKYNICCVLEKPSYNCIGKDGKKYIKNGFHLHFPYTFLSKTNQETHLIPRVKKMLDKSKVFKNLGIENASELYDCCYLKNPWLMYGSQKNIESGCYKLTTIYNDEMDEIELDCAFDNYKIYDSDESEIEMKTKEDIEYNLPRILSIIPWYRQIVDLKPNLPSLIKINSDIAYKKVSISENVDIELDVDDDGNTIRKRSDEDKQRMTEMLSLLNLSRFKKTEAWITLCYLIKANGLPRELFLKLSEASGYEQYNEEDCLSKWCQLRPSETSVGFTRLQKWLDEDGVNWREKFCKKKSSMINDLLQNYYSAGTLTDLSVAEVFHKNYKDNLINTQIGWIHFVEGKGWINGTDDDIIYPLMKLIGEKFISYASEMKPKKGEDEKEFMKKIKGLKKEGVRLCSASVCQKIIKTAKPLFFDNKALETFDKKPSWLCFSNMKAIDLSTKEVIDIKATDRILTTTGYKLPERVEKNITKAKSIVESIVPEKNFKSLLSALSIFLYGENINEKFIVFKGEGRNGKGLIISLLEVVLGDYYYSLPTEILTEQSKGAGRANPELAQTQFKRCVIASEPDASKTIVKTTVNLLTGRDTITARQLHSKPVSFRPPFTLGMMCNDCPNISGGINDAIKNRMEFQSFPYTFMTRDKMDQDNPNHKLINEKLKEEIRNDITYRDGLLYILIDTWFENKGRYISCDDSKEEQKIYIKANNPVIPFLQGFENSDKEHVNIRVLHKEFQSNYSEISESKFKNFLIDADPNLKIIEDKSNGHKVFLKRLLY